MQIIEQVWIPIEDSENAAIVLNTALLADGWQTGHSNIGQKLMTAKDHVSETEGAFTWENAFALKIRWAPRRLSDYKSELLLASAGSKPRTSDSSIQANLSKYADQRKGQIVFIELSDAKARSEHKLKERVERLKLIMVQEAEVFLLTGHPKPNPDVYPASEFSSKEKLKSSGYLAPYEDHRRFIVSKIDGEFLSIPARESNRHVLVAGPTGTGKTRSIFAPNLFERTDISMIVTEATAGNEMPHLYKDTSGWRFSHGHKVLYFNPDDLCSDQLNPLDMITTDREARMVCELIMKTTTQKSHRGDQFWDTSERMLLTALLLHVCAYRQENMANLGHVVDLVNRSEAELRKIAMNSPVQQAYQRFEAFFSRGTDNTRNIVLSCLGQRLDLWNDARTRALTGKTSFDISALQESLFTLYLVLSAEKDEFKPLAVLVWHYVLHIVSNYRFKHPISLLLDEFANLGYVRGMKEKLSLFRHLDIGVVLGIQDPSQVKVVYEQEDEIFFSQPATKIFLTPNQYDKAKAISEMLGMTTLIDPEIQGGSVKYHKIQRPLLSPEQIMNPAIKDQLIVFFPNAKPAQISHIPWNEYNYQGPVPQRTPLQIDEGLIMRDPSVLPQPSAAPWDPMDPKKAQAELNKRKDAQIAADKQQEALFQNEESQRIQEDIEAQKQEIQQMDYYNSVKANLLKEISGLEMAQQLLDNFSADLLELLDKNKGRELNRDEIEAQEIASLKVRIMQDVLADLSKGQAPLHGADYPLPWQN